MSIQEYILVVSKKYEVDPEKIISILNELYDKQYIKKSYSKPKSIISFNIDEYRRFFSAAKLGIPGKMGDKKSCETKMTAFLDYYGYDWSLVLRATENYINSLDNPIYCKQADYFIEHTSTGKDVDRRSMLSIWCEDLLNGSSSEFEAI